MITEEEVRRCIQNNDGDVCKAIVAVYRKQTKGEQETKHTHETNGVGFNKFDAEILTSFAEQIIRNKRMGRPTLLSPKQIRLGRKKIIKYSKQVAKILNGEV